jgi:hypothetical protein
MLILASPQDRTGAQNQVGDFLLPIFRIAISVGALRQVLKNIFGLLWCG